MGAKVPVPDERMATMIDKLRLSKKDQQYTLNQFSRFALKIDFVKKNNTTKVPKWVPVHVIKLSLLPG